MRFSAFVERIGGEGVEAWNVHRAAIDARDRGEDVIVLSVGDPEFATPKPIIDEAIEALLAGDTHYTPSTGRNALRHAIAESVKPRLFTGVDYTNVIALAGAQNALFSVSQCICAPGDEIIVPEPMYLTYKACVESTGARLIPLKVDAQTLRIDEARLAALVTPRTKAIFFASPCNPSGMVMSRGELEAIAGIAQKHDLWVVSDEVYSDLIFEGEMLSMAALPGMAERTVTLGSLSKSHAMAGWRVGWAIGSREIMKHLSNLAVCALYGLPGFVQQAAIKALEERANIVPVVLETYRRRRDLVFRLLSDLPGTKCTAPQAGMFLLLDIRGTSLSSYQFSWQLFKQTGVSVLDATPFGSSVEGFVRIGFVLDEGRLEEACRRIQQFVATLQKDDKSVLEYQAS